MCLLPPVPPLSFYHTMADGGKVSPQLAEFIQQEQAKAQVREKNERWGELRERG